MYPGLAPLPLTLRHPPPPLTVGPHSDVIGGSGQEHSVETLTAASSHHHGHTGPQGCSQSQQEAQPGCRRESKHALAKSIRLIG